MVHINIAAVAEIRIINIYITKTRRVPASSHRTKMMYRLGYVKTDCHGRGSSEVLVVVGTGVGLDGEAHRDALRGLGPGSLGRLGKGMRVCVRACLCPSRSTSISRSAVCMVSTPVL